MDYVSVELSLYQTEEQDYWILVLRRVNYGSVRTDKLVADHDMHIVQRRPENYLGTGGAWDAQSSRNQCFKAKEKEPQKHNSY